MKRIFAIIVFVIFAPSISNAQTLDENSARQELVTQVPELAETERPISTAQFAPDAYIFIVDNKNPRSLIKQIYLVDIYKNAVRTEFLGDFQDPIIGADNRELRDRRRNIFISTRFGASKEREACLAHPGNYAYYLLNRQRLYKPRLISSFTESCDDLRRQQNRFERVIHFVPIDAH